METPPYKKLEVNHDEVTDMVTIEGIHYSGALFRALGNVGGFPVGAVLRILKREDGILTMEKVDMTRIRVGPLKIKCAHCKKVDELTLDLENPNTSPASQEPKP